MSTFDEIVGTLDGQGQRFGLVASRYYEDLMERMVKDAIRCLEHHGGAKEDVTLVRVPGAWEIPGALAALAETGRYDALVALGIVIRGETTHYDYVCSRANDGCGRVADRAGLPVGFGVLTCEDGEQAAVRAEGPRGKGWEAALAALEMSNLYRRIREMDPYGAAW
ncbi:MAG: 6,7-dimethyl-8-ribityllumazine synthase [Acidobacteriota bacterium]